MEKRRNIFIKLRCNFIKLKQAVMIDDVCFLLVSDVVSFLISRNRNNYVRQIWKI